MIAFILWISSMAGVASAVDFSGQWEGEGTMTQVGLGVPKKTVPCKSVQMIIEHIPKLMTMQRYKANCGTIQPDWGPNRMEIRGTKIFEDDEETGSLEGNLLKTLTSDGGVQYAFNLRLNPAQPKKPETLDSYYGVRNRVGTIVIEGSLKRAHSQ